MQKPASESEVKALEERIESIENDIMLLKRSLAIKRGRKDPNAWKKLEKLGKEIGEHWQAERPSWQIISDSRR